MAASYPGAVKSFVSRNAGDVIQPAHVNDLQDEVNAIESGLLNGTAPLNSSNSTMVHVSATAGLNVVGNSTFGSTVTIGGIPMIFPSAGGSTGQVLTISSTSGSTLTLSWAAVPTNQVSLLKANSGTVDPNVTATIDSVALSGLTAKDRLAIYVSADTDQNAPLTLVSVTDANGTIANLGTLAGANQAMYNAVVSQQQTSSTRYFSLFQSYATPGATAQNLGVGFGAATAWTGAWTLGLRVTTGSVAGTLHWSWLVYKMAGQ